MIPGHTSVWSIVKCSSLPRTCEAHDPAVSGLGPHQCFIVALAGWGFSIKTDQSPSIYLRKKCTPSPSDIPALPALVNMAIAFLSKG